MSAASLATSVPNGEGSDGVIPGYHHSADPGPGQICHGLHGLRARRVDDGLEARKHHAMGHLFHKVFPVYMAG